MKREQKYERVRKTVWWEYVNVVNGAINLVDEARNTSGIPSNVKVYIESLEESIKQMQAVANGKD